MLEVEVLSSHYFVCRIQTNIPANSQPDNTKRPGTFERKRSYLLFLILQMFIPKSELEVLTRFFFFLEYIKPCLLKGFQLHDLSFDNVVLFSSHFFQIYINHTTGFKLLFKKQYSTLKILLMQLSKYFALSTKA